MSCGAPLVPERVQQVVDDRKKATKRVEDLEAELAASVASELASAPRVSRRPTCRVFEVFRGPPSTFCDFRHLLARGYRISPFALNTTA